jgi:kumamolisin
MHHYLRHHPRLRGVRTSIPSFPAGSLSPAQVLKAYGFTQGQYAGAAPVKIGIGSLGGGVVTSDLVNASNLWGMASPTLTIRTIDGGANDVSDQDSNVENSLDLQIVSFVWWYLTNTAADVTITFGPNLSGGMQAVTQDLVAAGCQVCSWSWGGPADKWSASERAGIASALAAAVNAGVIFCAASGDNSIDDGTSSPTPDYPCSDPNVWAVGGTSLTIGPNGLRTSESAWGDGRPGDEGGGGGYDPTVPVPAFQKGVIPVAAPGRGVPDTSANADPNTGWQIGANTGWTVVGGTSAASPFIAALIAVARGMAKAVGNGVAMVAPYGAPVTSCNDITSGSDGDPATPGWDSATGLGSPNGATFIQTLVSWMVPQAAPVTPPGTPGSAPTLQEAIGWATNGINAGDPLQTQDQAIAAATSGLTAGWPQP